jgi:hypothetical protein
MVSAAHTPGPPEHVELGAEAQFALARNREHVFSAIRILKRHKLLVHVNPPLSLFCPRLFDSSLDERSNPAVSYTRKRRARSRHSVTERLANGPGTPHPFQSKSAE